MKTCYAGQSGTEQIKQEPKEFKEKKKKIIRSFKKNSFKLIGKSLRK